MNRDYEGRYWLDPNSHAIAQLQAIAREAGLSLTQLALRRLPSQEHIESVILGVTEVEHLEVKLEAADGRLDAAAMQACGAV